MRITQSLVVIQALDRPKYPVHERAYTVIASKGRMAFIPVARMELFSPHCRADEASQGCTVLEACWNCKCWIPKIPENNEQVGLSFLNVTLGVCYLGDGDGEYATLGAASG